MRVACLGKLGNHFLNNGNYVARVGKRVAKALDVSRVLVVAAGAPARVFASGRTRGGENTADQLRRRS